MILQLKISEIVLGLKKENKAVKDRLIRDIRNLFEHDEEDNCK